MTATNKAYYEDSYMKTLSAIVTHVDGACIELDRTIFYPEGGGQPGDTGELFYGDRTFRIEDTRKGADPDTIVHHLAPAGHGLSAGDPVTIEIDWDRRYKHMRMHTSMHLLGSLIPVPVTGGSVGAEKSRLDFDLGDHQIDKDDLTQKLNALVEAAHPVVFETITDQELDENPGLVRTMSVQPPRGAGVIRMVRVVDVDYQPCGGTHINNTREIGPVRVSKIENKGKRNRRVHLVFDS
jgi:misacylated tRNA(Ala) deacylase